jgi:hypothetical protein
VVFDIGITLLMRVARVGGRKGRVLLATQTFPRINLIPPACALFFGNTMDIYTTVQGLLVGNSEGNPVPAHMISAYGLVGFALYKMGVILALLSMVFLATWLAEKRKSKPQDIYFARKVSHFGLWLSAACYIPVVANNLITFYVTVHGGHI